MTTKVQSPDYFGAVASFSKSVIDGLPTAADKAAQQKAALEASEAEAMNLFTTGVQNILSGEVEIPGEISHSAGQIKKMQRAGLSPIQIDAEIQKLIKRVSSKYPQHSQKYYAWLNDNGLDDFVFTEAKKAQLDQKDQEAQRRAVFGQNLELVRTYGYDVDNMSTGQIYEKAMEINRVLSEYNLRKLARDELHSINTELRAAESHKWTGEEKGAAIDKRELEEAERLYAMSVREMAAMSVLPTLRNIDGITRQVRNGEISEKDYRATLTDVLRKIEMEKSAAISDGRLGTNNISAISSQYDQYIGLLQSLLDGELSQNEERVRGLLAWEQGVKLNAIQKVPMAMVLDTIAGQAGWDYILSKVQNSTTMQDASVETGVSLGQMLLGYMPKTGADNTNVDAFLKALESPDPSATANVESVSPQTYKDIITFANGTLPQLRSQVIANPTKETAQHFYNSFSSLVPELQELRNRSSSTEAQAEGVLRTLPVRETIAAILAYKQATGDEKNTEKMTREASNAYSRALQALYKDYTSTSLGSILSPMKRESKVPGDTVGNKAASVEFDESRGVFVANKTGILVDKRNQKTVDRMNSLLDGAVLTEKILGHIPPGMSDIGARVMLVTGSGDQLNEDVLGYVDSQGWSITSTGELIQRQGEKTQEEAKTATGKKTETTTQPKENTKVDNALESLLNFEPKTLEDFRKGSQKSPVNLKGLKAGADISPRIDEYIPIIEETAKKYGIPPEIIVAVIDQESRGQKDIVSPKGAQGLMQLMPDTAKDLGVTDSFDPAQNIDGGVRYLRQMLDKYDQNLVHALMAYNWGPTRVDNWIKKGANGPIPKETEDYLDKILGRLDIDGME